MRQGGESQGVQVVRQGEPTPYHCDFNPLYFDFVWRERFPFIAGGAVPEMYQRFEMAAAVAVHERFL